MKASDLMIGDLVFVTGNPVTIHSIREKGVGYLTKENGKTLNLGVPINELKPIPLTGEMLIKNGFGYISSATEWYLKTSHGLFIIKDICISLGDLIMYQMNCCCITRHFYYVHELQHALRLCGLTDLADNFKI